MHLRDSNERLHTLIHFDPLPLSWETLGVLMWCSQCGRLSYDRATITVKMQAQWSRTQSITSTASLQPPDANEHHALRLTSNPRVSEGLEDMFRRKHMVLKVDD